MKRLLCAVLLPLAAALAAGARADQAAPAATPEDSATLKADNKQLSGELADAWKEADRLKADLAAAKADASKNADKAADLQKQLDAIKPTGGTDAASQLAEVQDKLATSLRSFTVLQDENTDLKATIDKLTGDNAALTQQLEGAKAANASLQAQAAAAQQIDPLRAELRQAEDEASRLATENGDLRTRLSLQAPAPGSREPVPMRPGSASAGPAAKAAPAPEPAAERTYTVAEGDTLSKISKKFYGTPNRWDEILKANAGTIKDEKALSVGTTIKIP